MMKKTTFLILAILCSSLSHSKNWYNNIQTDIGIGLTSTPNKARTSELKLSPHIGMSYKIKVFRNVEFSIGVDYHSKSYHSNSQKFHYFHRDDKLNEQVSIARFDGKIHQLGVPIYLYYTLNQFKVKPYIFVGIMPQYNLSGNFEDYASVTINNEFQGYYRKLYKLYQEGTTHSIIKGNTQYPIGIGAKFSKRHHLQIAYHHKRTFQSFGYQLGFEDFRMHSFKDHEIRLSWVYQFR